MSEDKTVYVNKKTYEEVVEKLDYVPSNLKINDCISDNRAVVIPVKEPEFITIKYERPEMDEYLDKLKENLMKGLGVPKEVLEKNS
jgi:hypothetical protein